MMMMMMIRALRGGEWQSRTMRHLERIGSAISEPIPAGICGSSRLG